MLLLLKAVSFILGHLPVSLLLFMGRLLGSIAYRLDRKHREIALTNLETAFGAEMTPKERERIAKRAFANLAMNLFEFTRVPWLREKDLEGYVECTGFEHIENALKRKRGIVLLASHFGNWEMMAAYYGLKGYTLDIVVRDIDSPVLDEFVRWVRTRPGNRIISKSRSMRRLLKCLSSNSIAGILLDQNVTWVEGVFVDFFGKKACTNKGPALLASVSKAAVVPSFIVREGNTHRVIICPEVRLVETGDKGLDAVENTARCTRVIEEMIRRYPDQWFWIHRRWKTRPPEEDGRGG